MMAIHGRSLGILPIMMTIMVSTPFILTGTLASPSKVMIDLDISGQRPARVKVTPSERYPGGTHYSVQKSSRHIYMLGMVRDGQDVLMDGDPTAIIRYVLVQNRQDGMRYIRVITRWRITGSFRNHVDEFVKRVGDAHYRPITRVPIEVDLLTQDVDQYIHVELVVDWEEHERNVAIGRTNGGFPEDLDTLPVNFTIQENKWLIHSIGVVTYGGDILYDKVDGLMERKVTWYGGLDAPIITISSRYNDGTEVVTKHELMGDIFRVADYRSRAFLLCG